MVEFRILGTTSLVGAGGRELRSVLTQPKRVALLAYLAAASPRGFHRRDKLLALFWPELDQEHARAALRQSLYSLRRPLGDGAFESRGDDEIGLSQAAVWCDAPAFDAAVDAGRHGEALELYRGDLLDGFFVSGAPEFEHWVEDERARLRRRATEAAWTLAEACRDAGNRSLAAHWARRGAALSRDDEGSLRRLIALLGELGDRAGAMQAYDTFARRLAEEYEVEPARETRALIAGVRSREASAANDITSSIGTSDIALTEVATVGESAVEADSPSDAAELEVEPAAVPRPPAKSPRLWGSWAGRPWTAMAAAAFVLAIAIVALSLRARPPVKLNAKRVLVVPMANRTGDSTLDALGNLAADWITRGLAQTGVLEIADPGAMVLGGRAGSATRRGQAGDEPADVRKLALASGSGLAVSGSMYNRDNRIEFHAQITDVGNRKILRTLEPVVGEAREPRAALTILRERLMAALAEAVDSRLGALASTGGQPPRYDAYLAFSTGVEIYYPGRNARAALPYFQRAAALDSNYALPLIWAAWAHSGTALDQCDSTAVIARRLAGMRLTPLEQMQIDRLMARCRGDLPAAYRLGRSLSEALPRSDLMKEQLARDALDWGRPREAVTILEALDPDGAALSGRAGYYNWLTNAYHLLDLHDRELAAARRARQRFPKNVATLRMELLALAALGRGREVNERLTEIDAFPLDPIRRPAPVMREVALDLGAHGDTMGARAVLERLLAWHASRPQPEQATEGLRFERAQVYFAAGHADSARVIAEQLHRARPRSEQYAGLLGALAARRGDRAEAARIDGLLATVEGPFTRGQATYWRACIAALLGERDRAVDLLARALDAGFVYPVRYLDVHIEPSFTALRTYPRFQALVRPRG